MCAKVVILPDSANSFPFFIMSVKVESKVTMMYKIHTHLW